MDIRLLICDIDDTLIGHDNVVSDRVRSTLDKVSERGITVAMATGRMHNSALPFVEMLGAHGPVISYNGALIIDTETGERMRHCPLSLEDARDVLRFAEETGTYAQYYSIDEYYIEEHNEASQGYHDAAGIRGIAVHRPLYEAIEFPPMKVLFICEPERKAEVYRMAQQRFGQRMEVVSSKDLYLEFTHRDANKGTACQALAAHYGVDQAHVMAIGNGHNDISMIQWAGWGVAVDNSSDEVKQAADAVTASQADDGAAQAIEQYILNPQD